MQSEQVERFVLETLTTVTARRDQEFIPLHRPPNPPKAQEAARSPEEEVRRVFEEAYVEGEKAGFEMGMKKVEPLVERLNRYIREFESYRQDLEEQAQRLAFGLALAFAESIVLKECTEHRDVLLGMVRKALDLCEQKGKKIIRVRPEDMKFIEAQGTGWTILPDDTLREPGFIIETDFGDVDGRLSTQLEEIKREFLGGLENRSLPVP